jgi:Na+/alanine symporter
MNAMMVVPNLIGLILLSGKLSKDTQAFEVGIREGTINKFD